MARSKFLILIASLIFSSICCYAREATNINIRTDTNVGLNIAQIQKLTGQTGQLDQDENIYKITIPRDDLKILMSGMQISPELGLSSWIAFKKTDNQTSVNGDLILLQDQINPVMSVALTNGLQVTGLHSPYLWDSPRVMYMHIRGQGDELQLANAVGLILKKIKATSNGAGDFPLGDFDFLKTTLDAHKIDAILGQKGQFKDDVYKIEFGDGVKATDTEENKAMAINSWAAFAGSDSEAVVNGTMVLHKSELQKALVKLRNAQIFVLAIYQNMISTGQDLVLVNYWGVGNTETLARTIRTVFLIAQNTSSNDIMVGEIAPSISPSNTQNGTEFNITPIQLALSQKEYCGYARTKEIDNTIDIIRDTNTDYAKQLGATLQVALNLTQKIVSEKMIELVSYLPTTSFRIDSADKPATVLPSAENLLLKLSAVSKNVPGNVIKSLAITTVASSHQSTDRLPASLSYAGDLLISEEREVFTPSARMIIARLPVVQKSNIDYLTIQPANNTNFVFGLFANTVVTNIKNTTVDLAGQLQNSVFIHPAVVGVRSLAKTVPTILIYTGSRSNAYLSGLAASYVTSTESNFASISTFYANVIDSAHQQIHKIVDYSCSLLTSIGDIAVEAINSVDLGFNTVTQSFAKVSKSMDYADYAAVSYAAIQLNEFKENYIRIYQSGIETTSDTVARMHVRLNDASNLSADLTVTLNQFDIDAVNYIYSKFNEFAVGYTKLFKSLALIVLDTGTRVQTQINHFYNSLEGVSKSLNYVAYNTVSYASIKADSVIANTSRFARSYILGFENFVIQTFSLPKEEMVQLTQFSAKYTVLWLSTAQKTMQALNAIQLFNSKKAVVSSQSNSYYQSALFSLPVILAINDTHATKEHLVENPSTKLMPAALPVAKINRTIQANTLLPTAPKKASEKRLLTTKRLASTAIVAAKMPGSVETFRQVFLPSFALSSRPFSPMSKPVVAKAVEKSMPHTPFSINDKNHKIAVAANTSSTGSNKTEYTIPNMLTSFAKILIPTFMSSTAVEQDLQKQNTNMAAMGRAANTVAHAIHQALPSVLPIIKETHVSQIKKAILNSQHAQFAKSLNQALSLVNDKDSTARLARKEPASLPIPRHKVVRVATLSNLNTIIPPVQHKIRLPNNAETKYKHITVAISKRLPHAKSATHQKVAKTNRLPSTVFVAQHKTHPYVTKNNRTEPHHVVYTRSYNRNWNAEKLSPASKMPVRSVVKHDKYSEPTDVDDGPAVVGYYPYDEEPSQEGFGA